VYHKPQGHAIDKINILLRIAKYFFNGFGYQIAKKPTFFGFFSQVSIFLFVK